MPPSADEYWNKAIDLRILAKLAGDPEVAAELQRLAGHYERLAGDDQEPELLWPPSPVGRHTG